MELWANCGQPVDRPWAARPSIDCPPVVHDLSMTEDQLSTKCTDRHNDFDIFLVREYEQKNMCKKIR